MNAITRRLFLRNTASMGAAATVAATPALAAKVAGMPENPELLRLGDEFAAAMAEHDRAAEKHRAARARYQPPHVPDELIIQGAFGSGLGDYETDCEGRTVQPRRLLYRSAHIAESHDYVLTGFYQSGKPARAKAMRHMRPIYDAAVTYEAAKAAAIEACGVIEANQALSLARGRIEALLNQIRAHAARTERGVTIKATAIDFCHTAGGGLGGYAMACLADSFAADYLAVIPGRAQS